MGLACAAWAARASCCPSPCIQLAFQGFSHSTMRSALNLGDALVMLRLSSLVRDVSICHKRDDVGQYVLLVLHKAV
eukprot:247333-Chlamydomonas_euryale.AAC.1